MDAARVYRVGRDPENDIVIEHGSVSRAHCELKILDDGAILLADLDSMNGTAVRQNGQWEHIDQATVERDERILLGEIVTTVAALLARAPKPSDRTEKPVPGAKSRTFFGGVEAELPGPAKPRRMPRPTEPAKSDPPSSGLISRLIQSDWARLHRRSSERKPRRDEPSICLPAIVKPASIDPAAGDRPGREPPSLRSQRPPTAPVSGFGAPPSIRLADDKPSDDLPVPELGANSTPVDFAALAGSPMLALPAAAPVSPLPGAPPDVVAAPLRHEPSLRAHPADSGEGRMPLVKPPFGPRNKWKRWAPRPKSSAYAKWAGVAAVVLLTSGGAVAAYLKYGPEAAPAASMAAVTAPAPAGRPGAADDRAPGDPPRAVPTPKAADASKPPEKRTDTAAAARPRTWQHSIDGSPDSAIHGAAAARDGLCLTGVTSLAGGGQEAWVIRLDTQGTVRWQRRPGGAKRDAALAVASSTDGGCVAVGYDNDETRLWVFKIDATGVLAWNRAVPAGHSGRAVAIQRLRDGGFAVAAHAKPAADKPDRAFVLRLSAKGEIRWSKYAGKGESLPSDLRETLDGGVIVAGMARESGQGRLALWAARLDREGRTRWEEHYAGPGTPAGARIEVARGKEYVIAATMTGIAPATGEQPGSALRLLRIHDDGEVIWDRRHAGAARRVAGLVLARGAIFVAGDTGANPPAPEIWLAQFDATGRPMRENRLPAGAADRAAALTEMADGRLVIAGTAEFEATGRRGAGLVYLDRTGHLVAER